MTHTALEILKDLPRFKLWLAERGAEILGTTNEYELVRFRTGKGTSVIYRKKHDNLPCSFIGDAATALREFRSGGNWRAIPATRRRNSLTDVDGRTIRKRDGNNCFFCGHYVSPAQETIEHLVALTHGGPQHISNKFLAHLRCNLEVGHASAVEKIKVHDKALRDKIIRDFYERRSTARE